MKGSMRTVAITTVLSLALTLFLCYQHSDPQPSPGEVNFYVGSVAAVILSLKWVWSRVHGRAA